MNIRTLRRLVFLPALALLGATAEAREPVTVELAPVAPAKRAVFYSIRPDLRRCVSPLCGGYFIKRVNFPRTRCADGVKREECYVAEIRWAALGFSGDPGAALVKGVQRRRNFPGFGRLGVLVPEAAWRAAGADTAPLLTESRFDGRWFSLRQSGIVCVTSPCYNIEQGLLNRKHRQLISGVDLSHVDAAPEDVEAALKQLRKSNLIAVGKNVLVPDQGPAGDGLTMVASDFFLPLKARRDDPLFCTVDTDCTLSVYQTRVENPEQCYCPLCPEPISAAAAKENEMSWRDNCSNYGFSLADERSATLICPAVLCTRPPPVACVNNQCVSLDAGPLPVEPPLR